MGFTDYERKQFLASMQTHEESRSVLDTVYPEPVVEFLKSEGLLRQVRDYCIMSKLPKFLKPENIVVTYLLDPHKTVQGILEEWQEFLSPPVRLKNFCVTYLNFSSAFIWIVLFYLSISIKNIGSIGPRYYFLCVSNLKYI